MVMNSEKTIIERIPDGWETLMLSEISNITSSKRIYKSDYVSSGIPFYRGGEISQLKKKQPLEEEYFISTNKYYEIKDKYGVPQKGDLLMTAVGTLGNVYYVPNNDPFYFKDGNLLWINKIQGVNSLYLYYQLDFQKQIVTSSSIGSTQKALTIVKISKITIPIPPLQEQRAIAEVLSDVDALIEAQEALIEKKRLIKQGVMQQLLTGKRRIPGFSGEWKEVQIGDIAKIEKGKVITEESSGNGAIPVIGGGKKPSYYHNTPNRSGKTITISASGANAGYVAYHDYPIYASDCVTIAENDDLDNRYLFQQLKLKQNEIYALQSGGAQPHVYAQNIAELKVFLPTINEQKAIAVFIFDFDDEKKLLEKQLEKNRLIKQGMMQDLLTGRTRFV